MPPDSSGTGPVGERAARRREQRGSGSPSRTLLAGLVTVGLLAVGGTGWAMTQGSGTSTSSASSSTSAGPSTSSGAGSSSTSASSDSSLSSESSGSATQSAAVPAALAACTSEVSSGDDLAKVSSTLAAHWRDHTSAQARVDKGEISASEAEIAWKRTKAAGPSDISKYRAASTAYEKNKGSCADMGQVPAGFAAAASKCRQHAAANGKVATSIGAVAASWAAHLGDMKIKSETPTGPYMQKWRGQVNTAPQAVKSYESAAAASRDAPRCSVTP